MKTDNLQVAEKLAKITGRPLEDFYEPNEDSSDSLDNKNNSTGFSRGDNKSKPANKEKNNESVEKKQAKEKPVESKKETLTNETAENTEKNGCRSTKESLYISDRPKTYNKDEISKLAKEWKANIGIHGNTLINNKREMTRKEYLDIRKSFKTSDEFMNHPLLLVMFRSENQITPMFPAWCDDVIKFINSNNKEKK